MKKISVKLVIAALLFATGLQAQSLQDGVNDYYAERFKSAKSTFEKLIAANPNNIEANYWLGQTFIGMEDVAAAKAHYEKALLASANAPLLLVGMGQVELMQNKPSEARQRFETALTMTRGKKSDDPEIQNAIGRAITEVYSDKEKKGDINWAIQLLTGASEQKIKNKRLLAEIYLNLANAHRKAKPGEAGGIAFQTYQRAIEEDPNFPVPYYRIAQLFNSQRNWDLYEKYLKDAVSKDERFAPAYYDLYRLALLGKRDFVAAEEYAKKYNAGADPDPQNDYLRIQTLWAKKDFDQAIAGAENIIAQNGKNAKARNYKLIADSYLQKKDTAKAKQYIDEYFVRQKSEEVLPNDYEMKAAIYSVIPGQEDIVYNSYLEAARLDTTLEGKTEILKNAATLFRNKNMREVEGDVLTELVKLKSNPSINELYDVMRAYYFGEAYDKSYAAAIKFTEKYPDEIYGWEFRHYNSKVLDTAKVDSIAVPDAIQLLTASEKDTVKFKTQYIRAASFLAIAYANKLSDPEKAIEYLKKWQSMDPANSENIQKNIDILSQALKSQNKTGSSSSNRTQSGSSSSGG
ncbi:MAG TPA: hypothetical protein PKC69_00890 [Chitinophagaceae bacterium]|nr:hypothetical protein [Chitinophagaceae bacterium]